LLGGSRGVGGIQVLRSSHVGGHVYAGNVLVFSRVQLYHGDWFGGINPGNAAQFLDALLACKVGREGVSWV
jgi:hypothetical protein